MKRFPDLLFFGLAAAIAGSLVTATPPAQAQPANPPEVESLVELNKKALREYTAKNWNAARKTLVDALAEGKKAKLDGHGVMARTYLHLGLVWVTGFSDRDKAVRSITRALEIDPAIRVRATMQTPAITAAFEAAQKEAEANLAAAQGPAVVEEAAAPAPVKPGAPLDCPNAGEAPADKPIVIRCAVAPGLNVATLYLNFRGPGRQKYVAIEMDKAVQGGGWYEIEIPPETTGGGGAVQYYVEGRDPTGKPIVLNGHSGSPNIMLVGAAGEAVAAVAAETPVPTKRQAADESDENPLEESTMKHPRVGIARRSGDAAFGDRRFWVGLGLGTGFGYAKGDGLEARPDLQAMYEPGLGWAGLGHLAPEFGYHIRPDMAVSLQGRVQWIPQPARYGKIYARGAQSLLARLLFFAKPERLRPFWTVMAGGGQGFRFTLHPDPVAPDVKDTVLGGPLLLGGGGGVSYQLVKAVSLVAEINALLGVPAFSAVADLNLAVQVNIY